MKVGINLINFGPSAAPDVLLGWAEMTERLGYHSLLTSDHVAVTPDVSERYPAPFYEPLSTLGWLAGVTSRIAIGSTVAILPYRHPLETARAYANIDRLSGGRLIFGVGIGWAAEEFAALGVRHDRRGALTDEYLDIIRRHWTEDHVSHDGTYTFSDVDTRPRPVQQPHPPIWVGGSSDAAFRRTARFATGWHPLRLRASWLESKGIPRLAAAAEEAQRPMPEICPRIQFRITDKRVDDADRVMGEGTIGQLHEDLGILQELGCAHVILDSFSAFDDDIDATLEYRQAWDDYERVAAEVLDLANESVR